MIGMYKIGKYIGEDMMSDLICDNYPMLLVLNRFGVLLGFGDKSIADVCVANNVHVDTFLSVVNLLISDDKCSIETDFSKLSLTHLVEYLHNSHSYFLDYRFPSIRQNMKSAIVGHDKHEDAISVAVLGYFDQYVDEVRKHMMYEEEVVFPYVKQVAQGMDTTDYKIGIFSDHHDNINSKLVELKNILIKYYPAKASYEISSVLFDIFSCENDLTSHNMIEDYLLVPAIKVIEHNKE